MNQKESQTLVVDLSHSGERIDLYLAKKLTQTLSRTKIQKLIQSGQILVNQKKITSHYQIKEGEQIHIESEQPSPFRSRAEDIPLDILYEDEDLMVVNKPHGLVVHPAHGNLEHTLVNALLYHTQQLSSQGGEIRPGIVHRLDKDTSGVMVVAKNDKTHAALGNQFKQHTIDRTYYVFVKGVVQHDEGVCEEPVGRAFLNRRKVIVKPSGGKNASTYFKVRKRFKKYSMLSVHPKTGRTHQIRVHMAHLGHPVLGDSLYGTDCPWIRRQALHAAVLSLTHPKTHERLTFESVLPDDMQYLLSQLESQG